MNIKSSVYLHFVVFESPNIQDEFSTDREYFLLRPHFMNLFNLLMMHGKSRINCLKIVYLDKNDCAFA